MVSNGIDIHPVSEYKHMRIPYHFRLSCLNPYVSWVEFIVASHEKNQVLMTLVLILGEKMKPWLWAIEDLLAFFDKVFLISTWWLLMAADFKIGNIWVYFCTSLKMYRNYKIQDFF